MSKEAKNKTKRRVDPEQAKMIKYINSHLETLSLDDRRDILGIIISTTPDSKIHNKGDGTQVHYKDLHNDCIISIYNFVATRIATYANEDISDEEQ